MDLQAFLVAAESSEALFVQGGVFQARLSGAFSDAQQASLEMTAAAGRYLGGARDAAAKAKAEEAATTYAAATVKLNQLLVDWFKAGGYSETVPALFTQAQTLAAQAQAALAADWPEED